MKVFISWAGDLSRQVGELLWEWLPLTIHAVEPYMSSEDVGKGTRWSEDLSRELEQSNFGVLCVTRDNFGAPWLNFEAGALSKFVGRSRVAPLLFDLGPADLDGPFLLFQATMCTKEDVHKLVRAVNGACPAPLNEKRMDAAFAMCWPQLHDGLERLRAAKPIHDTPVRTTGDMVAEVLTIVRDQQRLLTGRERRAPGTVSAAAVRELTYAWAELRGVAAALPGDEFHNALEEAQIPLSFLLSQLGGPPITR